jgi:hypothetical protein
MRDVPSTYTRKPSRRYQRVDQIDGLSAQIGSLTTRIKEQVAAAARTDTFLGERYRRIVRRRGKLRALVAIARAILVIIWHLLTSRTARFHEVGSGYYASRTGKDKKARGHIRQLEALGFTVTLNPAASTPRPARNSPGYHQPGFAAARQPR